MRNLSLWKICHAMPSPKDGVDVSTLTAVAVDPDQDGLYVASELTERGSVSQIEIWRVTHTEDNHKTGFDTPTRLASYDAPASFSDNPWSNGTSPSAQVISLRLLPDTRALVVITCSGDIVTVAIDDYDPQPEVVGSVESGITAAAWSPDDSLLVLVTGDNKLILMTSTFDILSEGPLHPTEFGEDAPIALGWGAKNTQFHGSLGKSAAQAALDLAFVGMSPDDDHRTRVSWRGDGAFFVVSAILPASTLQSTRPRRTLRAYTRDGALSSTAEPIAGLEHTLAWRPSGNLIASTQRFGALDGLGKGREGRHDVVFFERNGLRHGEFGLRERSEGQSLHKEEGAKAPNEERKGKAGEDMQSWGYRVKEVDWNADSSILSLWIEGEEGDKVQLWTTSNYHWYLKQEIAVPTNPAGRHGRFTTVSWHPEDAFRLILTTESTIIQRTYAWDMYGSSSQPPSDSGTIAVLDGTNVLLTPFRTQNVPPPMASHTLSLSPTPQTSTSERGWGTSVPIHAAFSSTRDVLVLLWESGGLQLFDLHIRIGPVCEKVVDPLKIWEGSTAPDSAHPSRCYRQVVTTSDQHVVERHDDTILAVLSASTSGHGHDLVTMLVLRSGEMIDRKDIDLPARNGRLMSAHGAVVWQAPGGELYLVDRETQRLVSQTRFPEFCFTTVVIPVHLQESAGRQLEEENIRISVFCGLSHNGKLYTVTTSGMARMLANNATSFTTASGFLIFTTTAHIAQFAPLGTISQLLQAVDAEADSGSLPQWETRRVERGSRIVTAIPSSMSMVLQMPRGNLETVYPRPLVLEVVRQDVDSGRYGKAFLACRKHRIDLNIIVEQNRSAFMERIPAFVDQVDDVDFINLFLTSLGQGGLPSEILAQICDGVRAELESRDMKKYVNSILTAHVVKRPPDHEGGLTLLLRLRDSEPQIVEDAVKYIIFLVDADKLFDTALGMYDFSLVLMIAQHAQKDPREYLPFLRELRALDHHYQRFRIDDHLRRYEKALDDLSRCGAERFDEVLAYVEKHQLYERALSIWQGSDHYETILDIYGDWLFDRRRFREAGFVFRKADKPSKAMVAFEKALDWQELFELASSQNSSQEQLTPTAYRVAEDLSSKKRHSEAARVLLDYSQDIKEAVKTLVEGSLFFEARRIIALYSRPELLYDVIYPGSLETCAQITEDLHEMRDQLRKQAHRIRELRVRKVEEPDAFYGVENADLHDVDVMTDISMAPTAFTRYTQAPSSVSRATSKRSSRSKRKMERKVGSGRKGTVDEEEYLLKSVTKLAGRFNSTQVDFANLLPHLLQFSEEHQSEGRTLQDELRAFETELRAAMEEIWQKPTTENDNEANAVDSWAARMREHERQKQIDPAERVSKPELVGQEWNLRLPS